MPMGSKNERKKEAYRMMEAVAKAMENKRYYLLYDWKEVPQGTQGTVINARATLDVRMAFIASESAIPRVTDEGWCADFKSDDGRYLIQFWDWDRSLQELQ
jgi:hypothetical protein